MHSGFIRIQISDNLTLKITHFISTSTLKRNEGHKVENYEMKKNKQTNKKDNPERGKKSCYSDSYGPASIDSRPKYYSGSMGSSGQREKCQVMKENLVSYTKILLQNKKTHNSAQYSKKVIPNKNILSTS